jgi:hypothetical protein
MNHEILTALLNELDWQLPGNVQIEQGGTGINIACDGATATLTYQSPTDLARGLTLLKQMGTDHAYTHSEQCAFESFGVMIDCSRNGILNITYAKQLLRLLALMGYNLVQLYTEDTYEIEGEPYFGYLRGRYSKAELKELDAYAAALGIELMPCMQTLAHVNSIFHWSTYSPVHDCNDILLCEEEKTYELIDKMLATFSECLRSRRIHIGMDEAHMVGLGKYLDKNGYHDRFEILARHLKRVCEIANKYGYRPSMWSDMFFRLANHGEYYLNSGTCEIPERVFANLPENIELVYWDYYHSKQESYDAMIRSHQNFNREIWFASSASRTYGFAPINEKNIITTAPAIRSCTQHGIKHMIATIWGDNGNECSFYALMPALVYTASLAYGNAENEQVSAFFGALTDMRYDDFMALDLLNKLNDTLNPATNLLYNDPLLGILDRFAMFYDAQTKNNLKKVLSVTARCAANEKYGYVFRTYQALTKVLQLKYNFGLRMRTAYKAGDREALTVCLKDCDRLLRRLDRLWEAFRAQWMHENKPHGFDVQDIRLGALRQRIVACRKILSDFLAGKTDCIPELEEEILPYKGHNPRVWSSISTVNVL